VCTSALSLPFQTAFVQRYTVSSHTLIEETLLCRQSRLLLPGYCNVPICFPDPIVQSLAMQRSSIALEHPLYPFKEFLAGNHVSWRENTIISGNNSCLYARYKYATATLMRRQSVSVLGVSCKLALNRIEYAKNKQALMDRSGWLQTR
jgi:hypothetical protein